MNSESSYHLWAEYIEKKNLDGTNLRLLPEGKKKQLTDFLLSNWHE